MSNLINTAMSGLKAAQAALSTVSNNISNQAVTGYSRQNALIEQAMGTKTSAGYIGNGVNLVSINRDYNEFISNQLRSAQATSSSVSANYEQISKIDNLLANSTTNLSSTIQAFFTNLQNLANNADDSATRQTMLGKAEGLVNQFKVTDKYLGDMNSNINTQVESIVGQVNTYSSQIANLNKEITRLLGANQGAVPNDLYDQRDLLVDKLNTLVGVDVTVQDGTLYHVSLKNGLSLVQGMNSAELEAIPSSGDPARTTVGYKDAVIGTIEIAENTISGGSLSGLLSFRSGTLDNTRNQIGQLALAFADAFNTQHKAGFDFTGEPGGDFFKIGSPTVLNNAKNTGDAVLTASFTDSKAVLATDYKLEFNGTDWAVTRLSTNTTVTPDTSTAGKLSFDGLEVTVAGTAPEKGDSFILKPVKDVIVDMDVAITDANKIAAASFKLDENGNRVQKVDGNGSPVVDADGNPVYEFGGPKDNTNAKALLALQNTKVVEGKSTLSGAYAGLVGQIGNETNTLKINNTSQVNVVKQLTIEQQSVSGVNLDEEYGDLMRFQQYYMANAQVIQTAQALFDALLSIRS